MKKFIRLNTLALTLFLIFSSSQAYSQSYSEEGIPQIVSNGFKALYPDVYVYEWKWKKKKNHYKAKFYIKGIKYKTYFTPAGEWIRTERDVKRWEVPEAVWNGLAETEYANWKVDDREEHQTPEYDLIYEIEVERGKQETLLYFLPDGRLVKTVVKR